jgi:hypothetical protein
MHRVRYFERCKPLCHSVVGSRMRAQCELAVDSSGSVRKVVFESDDDRPGRLKGDNTLSMTVNPTNCVGGIFAIRCARCCIAFSAARRAAAQLLNLETAVEALVWILDQQE